MLGWLGFYLAYGFDKRHQGEMYEQGTARAQLHTHLPDCLEERLGFDIAHRATDLYDGQVRVTGSFPDAMLDFIGDMGNDLYGTAQVIPAALLVDHILVNPAGGKIIVPAHAGAHEPLIMSQVQVGLRAVFRHINLAVLERAHGARINVDIRIQFQQSHIQSAGFQNCAQGSRGNPLP